MSIGKKFDELIENIDRVELAPINGLVTETVGMLIKAVVPKVKIGEVCLIKREGMDPLHTEVVGFSKEEVFLSPLGEIKGIGPSSEVIPTRCPLQIGVGPELLGRVINALGEPLDEESKGPLHLKDRASVIAPPPNPFTRKPIEEPLSLGVRCLDGVLTVGKGQRMGIFAAAGGGKSTLLAMIIRNAVVDVNVLALIGERGRELRDFIEKDLGPEGLARSIVVVSTSDQSSQLRLNASYVATAIAEYFRDRGKSVLLMMDSVTRFARALREVGLAAGEPPARGGYTPSVFSTLPKLLERSGNSDKGSITGLYTILVAGDDMNEPVADEVRSILDGHIILSADLARAFHYPAIDVLSSASRCLPAIVKQEHLESIGKLREVMATYKENEILFKIGEYEDGTDPKVDNAKRLIKRVLRFLSQRIDEKSSFEETLKQLHTLFR